MKPCVVVAAALYWVLAVLAPLSGAERRLQETAQDRAPLSAGIRVGETVVFDGIEFVKIPPGEFLMGSTSRHARDDEKPVTRVRISKGFYLGKTEVTQSQWQAVMGDNPSYSKDGGDDCPVEMVPWNDVQEFIGKLNARSGGERYRLPTEAEWEYAARAGTTTDTYAGNVTEPNGNDPVVNRIAWYRENSGGQPQPVGQKAPNGFGLYDMLGNVWEWVGGLVRGLSGRSGDGSRRTWVGIGPGDSGRQLGPHRRGLPVGESIQLPAGLRRPHPGLPPTEGGVALGTLTPLRLTQHRRGDRSWEAVAYWGWRGRPGTAHPQGARPGRAGRSRRARGSCGGGVNVKGLIGSGGRNFN